MNHVVILTDCKYNFGYRLVRPACVSSWFCEQVEPTFTLFLKADRLAKLKATTVVGNVFPFSDISKSAAVQVSRCSSGKARSLLPRCPRFAPFLLNYLFGRPHQANAVDTQCARMELCFCYIQNSSGSKYFCERWRAFFGLLSKT